MASRKYTIGQLEVAIKDNRSWRQTVDSLGLSCDCGGNTKTLRKLAEENEIDFSHFTGQASCKNTHPWNYVPVEKWLKKGVLVKSLYLKKKLIKEGMIKKECNECGMDPIWNGKNIEMELDHIDGDKKNNLLDNLRLLCPNCHSQTPTFRGRKNKYN